VFLLAVLVVYVALFVYYVQATMIGQPYWDMLSIVGRYLQYQRDGNLWAYLWEPHVQHRQIWMRLLTAFDARVLAGVAYPFVIVASACQLAAAWMLWRLTRQGIAGEAGVWLGSLVVMLMLTAVAAVDCAIPMNGIYPQTVLFVVLALVLFDGGEELNSRSAGWRRALALIAAMAAAFGNAAGLALWPILMWLGWQAGVGRWWLLTTGGIAVCFGSVYVSGLPGAAAGAGLVPSLDSPTAWRAADYFLTYMGLPWTRSPALLDVGRVLGGLICIAGVGSWCWFGGTRQGRTRLDRIALGLIAFSLATAALAAVGRSTVDADLRVPVRYSVFVALSHVGLLMLFAPKVLALWPPRLAAWAYRAVLVVAVLLTAQQILSGQAALSTTRAMRDTLARFAAGETSKDMESVVYVDLNQARRDLDAIHAAGLYLSVR
jgi:hypothetical protein